MVNAKYVIRSTYEQADAWFVKMRNRAEAKGPQLPDLDRRTLFVRDIYYLKRMSFEVVAQVALDALHSVSNDKKIAEQIFQQLRSEISHMEACRTYVTQRATCTGNESFVAGFERLAKRFAKSDHRFLGSLGAAIMSTVIEDAAFRQIAQRCVGEDDFEQLIRQLAADENEHSNLFSGILGPMAREQTSARAILLANIYVLLVGVWTLTRWWPIRVAEYEALGLDVPRFVAEVTQRLGKELPRLGIYFPVRTYSALIIWSLKRLSSPRWIAH